MIAIARAYGADPIEGMIAAGLLIEADLAGGALRNAVRVAPTSFLTDELHQRAQAGQSGDGLDRLRRMFRAWA